MAERWSRFTTEEVLKLFIGGKSTNKDDSNEEDTFTEYVGTTALDSAADSDDDSEDLPSLNKR